MLSQRVNNSLARQQDAMSDNVNSKCPQCKASVNDSLRYCPSCSSDIGFPNVRAVNSSQELEALQNRYEDALRNAKKASCEEEFLKFEERVKNDSHIVVAAPLLTVRELLTEKNKVYENYETLVNGGVRTPSPQEDDSMRGVVGSWLFGSYAKEIRYGTLSLNGKGLLNYGKAFMQLQDISVRHRTTFLNENSWSFFEKNKSNKHALCGFQSDWEGRQKLVAAKLMEINMKTLIQTGTENDPLQRPDDDWEAILLQNKNERSKDEFIEAHIYGSFNSDSIESIIFAESGPLSRSDKNDIEVIKELLNKE